MGTASKVVSVCFRLFEITCAAIVLGLISRFIHFVHLGDGPVQGRIIYGEVWAALSLFFAIVLILPFMYSFYAFALDFIMFVGWIVAFGLLTNVTPLLFLAVRSTVIRILTVDLVNCRSRLLFGLVQELLGLLLGRILAHTACKLPSCYRRFGRVWAVENHPCVRFPRSFNLAWQHVPRKSLVYPVACVPAANIV